MSEPVIHIGGVKIPLLDYAVSCNAILGIRDSGKTVTAKGIAEQLLDHDIPIVVFDAVGKWRWMKMPGPGPRGRGYRVVVAGGKAPDLALNSHSVGEIVRSAVKEKIPLIIDLYDPALSKADWRKIVQESIRIIHYEAVGVAHVFLEEAAEFIPQKPLDTNTYAEVEKLARMGGNASVGITLINQRAQEVNKAVLDLAVNLILGCQVGSKAIEWIGKWLDRLSPETAKAVTTSLPKLKSGEDWVWTRSNLDEPLREQMPMCRSLHPDRRTPEVDLKSAKAVDPEKFVERLKLAIPKIIEEAKAADPREWAKEKHDLQQKIKRLESAKPQTVTETKTKTEITTVEKRIVITGDITRLEKLHADLATPIERLETLLDRALQERSHIAVALTEARELNAANMIAAPSNDLKVFEPGFGSPRQRATIARPAPVAAHVDRASTNGDAPKVGKGEMITLRAIVQHGSVARNQLTILTGYKRSTRDAYIQRLTTWGLIGASQTPGEFSPTEDGITAAGDVDMPPTGRELIEWWIQRLPGGEREVFKFVVTHGTDVTREEIGEATGYARSSRDAYLQRLSSRKLIEVSGRGAVRPAAMLA